MKRLFAAENVLLLLLVFVPISFLLEYVFHQGGLPVFITSGLAIIPLAGLMGKATEHLAERVGEGMGAFLNATFGNAAELIIAIIALRAGLHDLVKASLTGSIIGNILLVFGLSAFLGGSPIPKTNLQSGRCGARLHHASPERYRSHHPGDLSHDRGRQRASE